MKRCASVLRVGEVVDRDEVDVGARLLGRANDLPADAAEPVDANLQCHLGACLGLYRWCRMPGVTGRRSRGPGRMSRS